MNCIYTARVPSNIAFIKYWGKSSPQQQWPDSDSLSMTLDHCFTETRAQTLGPGAETDEIIWWDSLAHRQRQEQSQAAVPAKLRQHLDWLRSHFGFETYLRVDTVNSFPAACGIASSASGMGALTLAALAAWSGSRDFQQLLGRWDLQQLAHGARMGSGSACRSLAGPYVHWQRQGSPDQQYIENFPASTHLKLYDLVVILDSSPKAHSSSSGHLKAASSPFHALRCADASRRITGAQRALATGDMATLGHIVESDCIEMHASMMTSTPPLHYWSEETSRFLADYRQWRAQQNHSSFFTVDAGPNPHLICDQEGLSSLKAWLVYLQNAGLYRFEVIEDHQGSGPIIECRDDSSDGLIPQDLQTRGGSSDECSA